MSTEISPPDMPMGSGTTIDRARTRETTVGKQS